MLTADQILNRQVLRVELTQGTPLEPHALAAMALDDQLDMFLEGDLDRDEGERLKVYTDTVGKFTIGVGRNLSDVGISAAETAQLGITKGSCMSQGITHAQAMALLDNDIDRAEADLGRHLPWWRKLDLVRQRVLANMCFNMGIGTLVTFHNTLRLIETGQYAAAADAMLQSKWARQVHGRATRLAALMRSGVAN